MASRGLRVIAIAQIAASYRARDSFRSSILPRVRCGSRPGKAIRLQGLSRRRRGQEFMSCLLQSGIRRRDRGIGFFHDLCRLVGRSVPLRSRGSRSSTEAGPTGRRFHPACKCSRHCPKALLRRAYFTAAMACMPFANGLFTMSLKPRSLRSASTSSTPSRILRKLLLLSVQLSPSRT